MTNNVYHIADLISKQLQESLSSQEEKELNWWLAESENNRNLLNDIHDERQVKKALKRFYTFNDNRLSDKIHKSIPSFELIVPTEDFKFPAKLFTHRIHFLKSTWFRYAAAIIIMLIGATFWYTQHNHSKSFNPFNHSSRQLATIHPGSNRALLTLADGRQITLDSTQGTVTKQGTLTIVNLAGKLNYEGVGSDLEYHTLSTPKGGQYQLVLPDGSRVWLNAASSITYPTAFIGKDREVTITGEAYFEINALAMSKNGSHKPFIVKTQKEGIVVLGTSFNVNSYPDEPSAKISLVEGSVKVENKILRPGQAFEQGKIVQTTIEQDIAWKDGLFNFNKVPLQNVLRQLSRWYDVEVVYEKEVPDIIFVGKMQRSLSLLQVLNILNKMEVNFRLEGKKLIVMP